MRGLLACDRPPAGKGSAAIVYRARQYYLRVNRLTNRVNTRLTSSIVNQGM